MPATIVLDLLFWRAQKVTNSKLGVTKRNPDIQLAVLATLQHKMDGVALAGFFYSWRVATQADGKPM